MPVDMRSKGSLRIVGMNHAYVFEPENAVGLRDGLFKTALGRDVVTGHQQMACVEAKADRQVSHLRRVFANDVQLFEFPSNLRARARRAFEEQHQLVELQAACRFRYALEKMKNSLLDRLSFVISRMGHHILRANRDPTHQFSAECLDRLPAYSFIRGREI